MPSQKDKLKNKPEKLSEMNINDLRALAKEKGVSAGGSKKDIIARLQESKKENKKASKKKEVKFDKCLSCGGRGHEPDGLFCVECDGKGKIKAKAKPKKKSKKGK